MNEMAVEYKVLLLDSYDGFRQAATQACAELHCKPIIIPAFDANVELVNRIKEIYPGDAYPDVIITRGAIATYLAQYLPNSVFSLASPDDMDFLHAIKESLCYGKRVGLIIRDEYEFDKKADLYKEILGGISIRPYRYEKAEDVVSALLSAKEDHMDITVGGGTLALKAAAKVGIPNIFVPTSVFSIKKALHNSLLYARFKEEERRKSMYVSIATNHIPHGILITEKNIIRFANTAMKEVVGEDVCNLINADFFEVFGENAQAMFTARDENIFLIKSRKFFVDRESHSGIGNMQTFVFQSISTLQEKETAIQNSLRASGYKTKYQFSDIVAKSPCMCNVVEKAKLFAHSDAPILITGASGTGKEVLAQSIHQSSARKDWPFVGINCAAIPRELFESELFGYEEGAFTSAKRGGKTGLFETARNGTVFLDEINSLSLDLQGKLLRVIEEGEFRKVGSEKTIHSDVRYICATNENLLDLVKRKEFRSDLYYRISTLCLNIASLNDRKEDILPLSNRFLQNYCDKYHVNLDALTPAENQILLNRLYEGNVRELENIFHRFVVQSAYYPRDALLQNCFEEPQILSQPKMEDYITIKKGTLEDMENEIIRSYLDEGENSNTVAEKLGISRSTLWRRNKDHTKE